jgi:hypothetical protein
VSDRQKIAPLFEDIEAAVTRGAEDMIQAGGLGSHDRGAA